MPIKVAAHLYRNRHGTFYFHYILPKCLRSVAGASEVRFSMQTEHRQGAIIDALPFIADRIDSAVLLPVLSDKITCQQYGTNRNKGLWLRK